MGKKSKSTESIELTESKKEEEEEEKKETPKEEKKESLAPSGLIEVEEDEEPKKKKKPGFFACLCGGAMELEEAEIGEATIGGTTVKADGTLEHEAKEDDEFLDEGEEEVDNVDTWEEAAEGMDMVEVELAYTDELAQTLPTDAVIKINEKGEKVAVLKQIAKIDGSRVCRRYRPLHPRLKITDIHFGAFKLYIKNLPFALLMYFLFMLGLCFIPFFSFFTVFFFIAGYYNAYLFTAQSGKMAPLSLWFAPWKQGLIGRYVWGSVLIHVLMFCYYILPGVAYGWLVEKFVYPVHDCLWTQMYFFKSLGPVQAYVASARLVRKSRFSLAPFFATAPGSCCLALPQPFIALFTLVGGIIWLFALTLISIPICGICLVMAVSAVGFMFIGGAMMMNYVSTASVWMIGGVFLGGVFGPMLMAVLLYLYIERVHRGEGRPDYPIIKAEDTETWDLIPDTPPYMAPKKGSAKMLDDNQI